jgi:ABC-2 type transport system permease protein
MNNLRAALWAETLKVRHSKVPFFTLLGLSFVPLVDALFMIILKDPEAARSMGLISAKAQLMVGVADWATFFSVLAQAVAVGGMILFAIIAAWVFGREFTDRTAKEMLALPTSRETIVAAKFIVITAWTFALVLYVFIFGLLMGSLVSIPGWSAELVGSAFANVLGTGVLTIAMLPFVSFVAGFGRGEMPAIGWTIFTVALSQIAVVTGWGDWFPWSVSALFSGAAGPRAELLGAHSYILVLAACCAALAATFYWWRSADQTK